MENKSVIINSGLVVVLWTCSKIILLLCAVEISSLPSALILFPSHSLCSYLSLTGSVSYHGRDTQTMKESHYSKTPEGVYVMRTASQFCCEMTDERGTHFTVMSNGHMTVDKGESGSINKEIISKTEGTFDEKEEPSEPGPIQQASLSPIVPRFFIIRADGTGSELLHSVDVKDFLQQAEEDPATAVLKSSLEGQDDVTGLTVLRPYSGKDN